MPAFCFVLKRRNEKRRYRPLRGCVALTWLNYFGAVWPPGRQPLKGTGRAAVPIRPPSAEWRPNRAPVSDRRLDHLFRESLEEVERRGIHVGGEEHSRHAASSARARLSCTEHACACWEIAFRELMARAIGAGECQVSAQVGPVSRLSAVGRKSTLPGAHRCRRSVIVVFPLMAHR